jgi:hypothetical protein
MDTLTDSFAYALEKHQELLKVLDSSQMFLFMELCDLLRPQIAITQPVFARVSAPITLPTNLQSFLVASLSYKSRKIDDYAISYAWRALREVLWQRPHREAVINMQHSHLDLFLRFGPINEVG